jgi:hypothetical protein
MSTQVDRRPVRLTRDGKTVSRHDIEQGTWHVRGWVLGRCLAHGISQPFPDKGDARANAIVIAKACARECRLPFFASMARTLQPLELAR